MTLNPRFEYAGLQLSVRKVLGSNLGSEAAMLMFLVVRGRVRKIEKSCYYLRHICPSARRSHGTTRLPLDGFSQNLIFVSFSKLCQENSGFINI